MTLQYLLQFRLRVAAGLRHLHLVVSPVISPFWQCNKLVPVAQQSPSSQLHPQLLFFMSQNLSPTQALSPHVPEHFFEFWLRGSRHLQSLQYLYSLSPQQSPPSQSQTGKLFKSSQLPSPLNALNQQLFGLLVTFFFVGSRQSQKVQCRLEALGLQQSPPSQPHAQLLLASSHRPSPLKTKWATHRPLHLYDGSRHLQFLQ